MQIRLFLLLLAVLFSTQVGAYKESNIHLSQAEYKRWVMPQLKKIVIDYHELITLMNPHLENYKEVVKVYREQIGKKEELRKHCLKVYNKSCLKNVNNSINGLGQILKQTDTFKTLPKGMRARSQETILKTYNFYSVFRQELFELYFELINYKFFYEARLKNTSSPKFISKKMLESFNSYNTFTLSNTNYRFSKSFAAFWNSFIKPLSFSILETKEKGLFVRKLNDLNLRWNVMHAELTKRNKEISPAAKSLLRTMHNRWNQVLKVTLR